MHPTIARDEDGKFATYAWPGGDHCNARIESAYAED